MKCDHATTRGACGQTAQPGLEKCRKHLNTKQVANAYRLTDPALKEAVQRHAEGDLTNTLWQLSLMHSAIEQRMNLAGPTAAEKIAAYNFVTDKLPALTKMTESFVRLGRESGELMTRSDVEIQNQSIIKIVCEVVKGFVDETLYAEIVDSLVLRLEDEIETDE